MYKKKINKIVMKNIKYKMDSFSLPVADIREVLIPWENCLKVIAGPISDETIKEMQEKNFDYAPVFSSDSPGANIIGLIPRTRLEILHKERKDLNQHDEEILVTNIEIPVYSNLDYILQLLASQPTRIVIHEGDANGQTFYCAYGLVNRSDLNKPPVRKIVYEILVNLEISLANYLASYIETYKIDPFSLIQSLSED